MLKFIESGLRNELGKISKNNELAFIILICERTMLGFEKFAIETGFYIYRYKECLNYGWDQLSGNSVSLNYNKLAQECFDNSPDTEDFVHPLTSAALNSALSIVALMRFLSDYKVDHIVEAAGLARDTVALYAQGIESIPPYSLAFDEVMAHQLVQQELRRQVEDLAFLTSLKAATPQEMAHLVREQVRRTSELIPLEDR